MQEEYNAISRQLVLAQQHVAEVQGDVLAKKQEALNAKSFGDRAIQEKLKQVCMNNNMYACMNTCILCNNDDIIRHVTGSAGGSAA